MKDLENAQMMLSMAKKDLDVLQATKNSDIVSDEMFGFHAEQAVEKTLKAWLTLAGVQYPKIHDLEKLFSMLEDSSQTVDNDFQILVDLTDFAVQFRYESLDEESGEKLDRSTLLNQIEKLVRHVERLVREFVNDF